MLHGGDRNESKAQPLAGSASIAGRGHNEPHMGARHQCAGCVACSRLWQVLALLAGSAGIKYGSAALQS